jgi:hypothetical protein
MPLMGRGREPDGASMREGEVIGEVVGRFSKSQDGRCLVRSSCLGYWKTVHWKEGEGDDAKSWSKGWGFSL